MQASGKRETIAGCLTVACLRVAAHSGKRESDDVLPMPTQSLPPLDPVAAARWLHSPRLMAQQSPWLHEEVAKRMAERLAWIRLQPAQWVSWEPLRGGMAAHQAVMLLYPDSHAWVQTHHVAKTEQAMRDLGKSGSALGRFSTLWRKPRHTVGLSPGGAHMLWANMHLHAEPNPEALLAQWHAQLTVNGFVMFSCLGPDTAAELRQVYRALGWAAPAQPFTDMHDWGDMLVHAGFAEPVMDMERITLNFASAARMLQELRELGRNLAPQRPAGLHGRDWRAQLLAGIERHGARDGDGRLCLSFEVIYGHALKPTPRAKLAAETSISLDDMRLSLRTPRPD